MRLLTKVKCLIKTYSKSYFPDDLNVLLNQKDFPDDFFGMNQNFIRASIVLQLIKTLSIDAFVETGTNKGATSMLISFQTNLPIFTCEINEQLFKFAKRNLFFFSNRIKLFNENSPKFLETILSLKIFNSPFIYLDAHWEKYLPLRDELSVILKNLSNILILIDDFRIPDVTGFSYDTYNGQTLELDYIRDILKVRKDDLNLFFPSYASSKETGYKSGWILISSDFYKEKILNIVPSSLLKEVSL